MKKNTVPVFILMFFLVIFAFRIADSFFIRTDHRPIGELLTHKLIGIALLITAVRFLRLKWTDAIGFKWNRLFRGILTRLAIGGSSFIAAYCMEIVIAIIQGKSPDLRFYVTSYNITGNTALVGGGLLLLICIIGNIINVVMENGIFSDMFITMAEKRYSFFIANGFFPLFCLMCGTVLCPCVILLTAINR